MISLGDSGSPLLIKDDENYLLIGVASWVKKGPNQNRGYGSSAGFVSVGFNRIQQDSTSIAFFAFFSHRANHKKLEVFQPSLTALSALQAMVGPPHLPPLHASALFPGSLSRL